MNLVYEVIPPGTGKWNELYEYICEIDQTHIPSISSRVDLIAWTHKLIDHATLFIYRDCGKIVACVADYVNKAPELTFGTHLSAKHEYSDYMLGPDLVIKSLAYAKKFGSAGKQGKIRKSNSLLLKFYQKLGFKIVAESVFPNSDVVELTISKKF